MKTLIQAHVAAVLAAFAMLSGCSGDLFPTVQKADAVAVLIPATGSQASGAVTFAKTPQGLRVIAQISNLAPGPHGFHIHEFGDCRAPDATSAGGHFNPGFTSHGAPDADTRHAGDLGNITADASGAAVMDVIIIGLHLDGPESIIGRSVIVHADPDDLKTQPTGAAGARLACGVIGIAH
jgi:Cu-Zn family superoxide dismutase